MSNDFRHVLDVDIRGDFERVGVGGEIVPGWAFDRVCRKNARFASAVITDDELHGARSVRVRPRGDLRITRATAAAAVGDAELDLAHLECVNLGDGYAGEHHCRGPGNQSGINDFAHGFPSPFSAGLFPGTSDTEDLFTV